MTNLYHIEDVWDMTIYLYINTDILGETAASIFGEVNVITIIIIIADFEGVLLCCTFCH